jgi:hypothetical protein
METSSLFFPNHVSQYQVLTLPKASSGALVGVSDVIRNNGKI